MKIRLDPLTLALLALAVTVPAQADDLANASQLLCAPVQSTLCTADGNCETAPPWTLNIPQFVRVDLDREMLSTTQASGENRSTPVKHMERDENTLYLQGVEEGRAFSIVIALETGIASIAVAKDGAVVSVFAVCTPAPR